MIRNKMHLTNCFFYEEWQDMGATISHCTYGQTALYECPCEGCNHFITAEDAREIVANTRTGRWVKTGQSFVYPDKFRNYMCSECGCDIEKTKYNYCPWCGARMEE